MNQWRTYRHKKLLTGWWRPESGAREPRLTQDLVPGGAPEPGSGGLDSRAGLGASTAPGNPASAPAHGFSKSQTNTGGPAW